MVHHSSEYYNLFTALRQSLVQHYMSAMFYLPAALVISPTALAIHVQFNTLYQFWIHTETIPKLGLLEYVLNTPSHHRVHHGVNRYCIDKNYAGTLIIWDRMFGTFAEEQEEVVYGLTHNINTFNPWTIQTHHFTHIWNLVKTLPGLGNKLSAVFKGPGWMPGKPRLGDPEDIPDTHAPVKRFSTHVPKPLLVYIFTHTLITTLIVTFIQLVLKQLLFWQGMFGAAVIWASFLSTGYVFDRVPHAKLFELHRCAISCLAFLYLWTRNETFTELILVGQAGLLLVDANLALAGVYGVSVLVVQLIGPWENGRKCE